MDAPPLTPERRRNLWWWIAGALLLLVGVGWAAVGLGGDGQPPVQAEPVRVVAKAPEKQPEPPVAAAPQPPAQRDARVSPQSADAAVPAPVPEARRAAAPAAPAKGESSRRRRSRPARVAKAPARPASQVATAQKARRDAATDAIELQLRDALEHCRCSTARRKLSELQDESSSAFSRWRSKVNACRLAVPGQPCISSLR